MRRFVVYLRGHTLVALTIAFLALWLINDAGAAEGEAAEAPEAPEAPFAMPVVVVKFFPVKGDRIDSEATGGYNQVLEDVRKWTDKITETTIHAMEEGSTYHGYKDENAEPSLDYEVLAIYEFREPTPRTFKGKQPMPDYNEIMRKIGGKTWVEEKGVKEVWIFSYHSAVMGLWESNMSSPWGDISNSDRDEDDLPVYKTTYTVYTYNYGRGPSEAMENHIHQIEHVINYVDGRDRTDGDEWDKLLFWGKFVGSNRSHKMIPTKEGFYRCGWGHYPPNAEGDYDWQNKRTVTSDIEDWKPDGSGEKKPVSSDIWEGNSYKWFIYWMQSIPGKDNGLTYNGKALTNWWIIVGDFDYVMKNKMILVEK
jgi:hypothetical protein